MLSQWCFSETGPSLCLAYVSVMAILPVLFFHIFLNLPVKIHKARREDDSIVDGIFVDTIAIEPRLVKPEERPTNFEAKRNALKAEVDRVKALGPYSWTEYQILSLNQMLVDFLKPEDLVARARSSLGDLEDYAESDAYGGYDRRHYGHWEERIRNAITRIERVEEDARNTNAAGESPTLEYNLQRDDAAEELRASLRTVLEHVADYRKDWAEGSTILRSLMLFCVVAIPTFQVMGLLRSVLPNTAPHGIFAMIDWGFLGIAGSLTAVLLALRKSDIVEVGNTDGKRELWRTVQGGALGLVAGILSYSLITGGLLGGTALPENTDLVSGKPKDIALSVLWAFAAGCFFERVFERVRTSTSLEN
jgi:hypothetical protein